jgi:hypothetical protein
MSTGGRIAMAKANGFPLFSASLYNQMLNKEINK